VYTIDKAVQHAKDIHQQDEKTEVVQTTIDVVVDLKNLILPVLNKAYLDLKRLQAPPSPAIDPVQAKIRITEIDNTLLAMGPYSPMDPQRDMYRSLPENTLDHVEYDKTVKAYKYELDRSQLKISEANRNYIAAVERAPPQDSPRLNQIKAQFDANIANLRVEESRHKADLINFLSIHKPINSAAFLKIKQALLDEKLDLLTSLRKHEIKDIEVYQSSMANLNMEALD
jgi:hypothetical protein